MVYQSAGQSDHIIFWGEKGQSEAQGAHRKMVTFLRQNLSRIFFFADKVISNDIDSRIDKTDRYFTNMGIERLHLMIWDMAVEVRPCDTGKWW